MDKVPNTVAHICVAHVLHRISMKISKQQELQPMKQLLLLLMARLISSHSLESATDIFTSMCAIMLSPRKTKSTVIHQRRIEAIIGGEIQPVETDLFPVDAD